MTDGKPMKSIDSYIKLLRDTYKGIREIWLFGSQANETPHPASDWDLLVFADNPTLELMKADTRLQSSTYDLFVVHDTDNFVQPWGKIPKSGSLNDWEWKQTSSHTAEYRATHPPQDQNKAADVSTGRARKLWP